MTLIIAVILYLFNIIFMLLFAVICGVKIDIQEKKVKIIIVVNTY